MNYQVTVKGEVLYKTASPTVFWMDDYTLPPIVIKCLKIMKKHEMSEISTTNYNMAKPIFESEHFKEEWYQHLIDTEVVAEDGSRKPLSLLDLPPNVQGPEITYTIEMKKFKTPDSIHKLYLSDKPERL